MLIFNLKRTLIASVFLRLFTGQHQHRRRHHVPGEEHHGAGRGDGHDGRRRETRCGQQLPGPAAV